MIACSRLARFFAVFLGAAATLPAQTLITPTSASASTEFNANYLIGYTIDGSGLPSGFGLSDIHAAYTINNHWTTNGSAVPGQSATFSFATAQSLTHFYLWNHLSTVPPANSTTYYVTQFDLTFRDAGNSVIGTANNLTAVAGGGAAQIYSFAQLDSVSSVTFTIDSNAGSPYTGLAEVRFGLSAVPEPASTAFALATVGVAAALWRRRLRAA